MSSNLPVNILLVDDKPENLMVLESILDDPSICFFKATSGNDALAMILEHDFAVVLLDVQMPHMDGFEIAELMRSSEKSKRIPIIFVTAISKDARQVFKGYETGAVDYLFKPLDPAILRNKVSVFIELYKQKRSLEQTARTLERIVTELDLANRKILEQQQSLIEEERLKMLLQMAGATAQDLRQPLDVLLGGIAMLEKDLEDPELLSDHMRIIKDAGATIDNTINRMQVFQIFETKTTEDVRGIHNIERHLSILSVESSENDFEIIKGMLIDSTNIIFRRVSTIADAIRLLKIEHYDLIMMDFRFPDGNGIDFLETMRKEAIDVPSVVITGCGDEIIATRMIKLGAYDYIPKSKISPITLLRIISNTIQKAELKKTALQAQAKMAEMSTRDELTGLYNRRYFSEALDREVARAMRFRSALVLCIVDLDFFKLINDTYGHPAGDAVLSKMGRLLKDVIRESDLICRYGGEEFAIILPNTSPEKAVIGCERLRNRIGGYDFTYGDTIIHVTLSVGLADLDRLDYKTSENLISSADKALYIAKQRGRNQVVYRGSI
ncbi:diguanylate cyclase [Desulforegula conservatrix]|uniref:diguanylate cyclase n=1 Tax=Desulforegula conservatrix TaxID=153026 RepID=UPI0004046F18|nr:diguanylate cyclase [Desulforegula conservatrix]